MSTLHELIYYCSEEDPMGAVLLTGEWGCGKTYLVETTLAKALSNSHMIVRVSLFGINSIDALNEAVHRQWLYVCTPFLGKLKQQREKLKKDSGFFAAVGNALRAVNPVAGGVASAMVAVDPIDLIPISPEADDLASGVRKKVVLVFDDLERSRLDSLEILGCINDYCENQDFNSIIIANEDEAFAYAGVKEEAALDVLAKKAKVAVVKIGKRGALIAKDGVVTRVQAGSAKAIDTTGAGDLWASGFLYGYMNGWDMERSGNLGSVVSNEVVQVMGAQIPEDGWKRILAARG